ncbi:MAG: hypothetical protein ABUL67_00350 [Haliangium ochraceum]
MARAFVSEFLLPLVRGGGLQVGRPLAAWDVERLMRAHKERPSPVERDAALTLAAARRRTLAPLVPRMPALELGEVAWRLGAAVHNLLALAHPRVTAAPGAESRMARIAAAAATLAAMGAPTTLAEMLARHSVVARLAEVVRVDHTVRYWLGRKTFVGRRPPARVVALPRLRSVKVDTVRRAWLRDVGIAAVARPAFAALTEASPLAEALNPARLDPSVSWGRVLSVLRFPSLGRLVARQLVDAGAAPTGDALAIALYRFASLQDTAGPVPASPAAVAFAVTFLAHLTWLDHLFDARGRAAGPARSVGRPSSSSSPAAPGEAPGREMAVLLAAAGRIDATLIWPSDVPRASDLAAGFARHLDSLFERHDVENSPRWPAALELGQLAASAQPGPPAGDAV